MHSEGKTDGHFVCINIWIIVVSTSPQQVTLGAEKSCENWLVVFFKSLIDFWVLESIIYFTSKNIVCAIITFRGVFVWRAFGNSPASIISCVSGCQKSAWKAVDCWVVIEGVSVVALLFGQLVIFLVKCIFGLRNRCSLAFERYYKV